MLIDRDVIMRQLRFLQQLLQRALKKQSEQDLPGALDTLRDGYREALGIPYDLLSRVDVASAKMLLRTQDRLRAYGELLRAEAEVLRAQGDEPGAKESEQRAAGLLVGKE